MSTELTLVSNASLPRLGELLVKRGAIRPEDLEAALSLQPQLGLRLGAVLMRMGALSEDALYAALAEQMGLELVEATALLDRLEAIRQGLEASGTRLEWWRAQGAIPWFAEGGAAHVAARDTLAANLREHVAAAFPDAAITWHLLRPRDAERVFEALRREQAQEAGADDVGRLRELAQEVPVIEMANAIFAAAVDAGASDIHLEPQAHSFAVRLRVDGVLHTRETHARDRFDALSTRVKLVSGLDIAERRVPQDGRVTIRAGGKEMDVRVSVIPGVHGESIVMRLLPTERRDLSLARLGLAPDQRAQFERWIRDPNGIVLVTGPTGSGKSTTLYTALALSNDGARKIVTVEDPVEYQLDGVVQIQTHAEIGFTFARALRSFLRHDPDVIMVGEIRDAETAEIAVQSALTGHMVFSTLHTNDAVGAFNRLLDMGVEPFLVASSLRGVIAQRLVRRLCEHCAREAPLDDLHARMVARLPADHSPARWREAVGCPACNHTGYRGRIGIYEFVPVGPALQQGILTLSSSSELLKLAARAPGYRSLRDDGLLKARAGITTVDEVLRVSGSMEEAVA